MINFDDTDGEERDDLEEAFADQESEEYDPTSAVRIIGWRGDWSEERVDKTENYTRTGNNLCIWVFIVQLCVVFIYSYSIYNIL